MFGKVFHHTSSDAEPRRLHITMSAKKPISLKFRPKGGDEILLANETTIFKGEITVDSTIDEIQCSFKGENLRTQKNYIKLEVEYR